MRYLRRRREGSIIAGVCSGLGSYFGIDPVVFRVIFLALTVYGASGILMYVILWIFIPMEAGLSSADSADFSSSAWTAKNLAGLLFIVLGVVSIILIFTKLFFEIIGLIILLAGIMLLVSAFSSAGRK